MEQRANTERVVRSAGIASAAVGSSRVTGLLREIMLARLFGAGAAYDAFLLAFRIPNLTRDLFAEGALSSAFVPTFTRYLTTRTKEEAAQLSNLVASAIILIVGILCLLGVVFAPQIVNLFAPVWLETDPAKFELAVRMTRIMFPFLLLVALAAQAMGMLNACNQFGVPAMSSTFFNIGSIASGLALGLWAGPYIGIPAIEGMAWGVVIGGALQLAWQLPSLRRLGFRYRPMLRFSDPGMRQILSLMGPAILGNAAVQVNVMVNTWFATGISDPVRGYDGPVSWLGYAFRFMQLPLGLFGVAIASATLPAISRSVAKGDMEDFRQTLSRSLGLVFLLTVPSSVGLTVLGRSIIGAVYQGGEFEMYDTQQTAVALSFYAIGLAGYAALKVLTPAFYALGDSRTPMVVSFLSILINVAVATAVVRIWNIGHEGLALSTSSVALFGFLVLFWILRNRAGGIYGRDLRASIAKVTLAAAAMGAVVWWSSRLVLGWFGETTRLSYLTDLAVSIPLGLGVFYCLARGLRVPELEMATAALAGPIARRLRR
ncbi:MAG: murein biosynthesis integral membrane protein MurJ [Bryobacteraceae bacterium]|nr:murein biosynthesis integral membrane protein MurJ [Bryobacteraceae bacterium]